ncbi:hypothetical protein GWK47_048638 [Chionoecetes opilio]|uniref:Glycosyltransferase family 92 protein n=1 Tax=Chionoecetes opilio TaxID=41210 RepID=A0A8J5CTR3_CHIOP|nr:hypothetical protein GWK47_048638 [Chionoecetes opilio]
MVRGWAAAVCGPALFYYHEDFSTRLVEWLELMRAQGFSQVFLHVAEVHPNIIKVLRHYTQEGFVEVTDYTYPSPYLNDPDLRRLWVLVERSKMFAQENVYFNDCILRHMHRYRFIAHFDPDEVPILPKHDNFTHLLDDLMASQKGKTPPGYKFQMTFFYDNLDLHEEAAHFPNYLWALRHTLRPCYFRRSMRVSNDTGFIGHYRNMCDKKCMNNTLHDLTLLKYKKQVGARVLKVLSTLQLL